jgi:hypothetical protein
MTTPHFDMPTQVLFWDNDGSHYSHGIAVGETVICSCCGGLFDIEEIFEEPEDSIAPLIDIGWCMDLATDTISYSDIITIVTGCYTNEEVIELAKTYSFFVEVKNYLEI